MAAAGDAMSGFRAASGRPAEDHATNRVARAVPEYAAGAPCWYELLDPTGSCAPFYQRMLGWTMRAHYREIGDYTICSDDDAPVAGIESVLAVAENAVGWIVYFSVERLPEMASAIAAAGGQVLVGPAEVAEAGSYLIAKDPLGALFGLWKPRGHIGAGVVDRPGAPCWASLNVAFGDGRDAAEFYGSIFGFSCDQQIGNGWELRIAGSPVADIRERLPIGAASSWVPFFCIGGDNKMLLQWAGGNAPGTGRVGTARGEGSVIRDPQGATVGFIAKEKLLSPAVLGDASGHGGSHR